MRRRHDRQEDDCRTELVTELVTELRSSRTDLARIVEAADRNKLPLLALGAEGTELVGEGTDMAGGF
jgi:hypothetical protein